MSTGVITHIAGLVVHLDGQRLRQRCAWCGAVLIDEDLSRVQVIEGSGPFPTFETGELIEVDGNAYVQLNAADHPKLPANACGRLDPEVTA